MSHPPALPRPVVLSVGDIVLDLLVKVTFPLPADQVIMTDYPLIEPGGTCNFAITASRLGLACKMAGLCGADVWGDLVVGILRAENVDTALIRQVPGLRTTLVLALSEPATLRQTYISAAVGGTDIYPALSAELAEALRSASALYVQGYALCEDNMWPLTERVMRHAMANDLPVYFDPSPLMVLASPDRQQFALAHSSVILATEDEIAALMPGQPAEVIYAALLTGRTHTLVVKRDQRGCQVVTASGTQEYAAYPVAAIGSVAAGDAFNAGFITAQLRGLSLDDSARVANATGAAKVRRIGGGRNVPQRAEVDELLRENGVTLDWSFDG